ncbi:MAG: CYTH domain-containing protein [Candidatus Uhrbacteria bacterium]|nr:CYTH domain-containing protein [Candidatus Uhrbacteria bacterium]
MFEVEQSLTLTAAEQARLLEGASFINEKVMTDVYWDTLDFRLTTKDIWLRSRDGKFELKRPPIAYDVDRTVDQYEELENESDVRQILKFESHGTMIDVLHAHGFQPFCTCTTIRKTYRKQEFTIVIDRVTYADTSFLYDTCEIELMVAHAADMKEASERIKTFARAHGLEVKYVGGKVITYLERHRPDHYQALVDARVIQDER